jgi:putative SOS response-associated peptidase YedK
MCGRYRRTTQEEELARLYHIPIPTQTDLPISYNIAPSQKVLTISLQSANATAIARRPSMGIDSILGEGSKEGSRPDWCKNIL